MRGLEPDSQRADAGAPVSIDVVVGLLAGLVATVPMSVAMEAGVRRLPWHERYALPPREITERLEDAVSRSKPLSHEQRHVATWIAHLGYGSAMGGLYGLLASALPPNAATGTAFGLGVWAVSYLGWLPATGLFRPATREPARRVALMVGAHVVWGLVLGATTARGRRVASRRRRRAAAR